MWAGLWLLTRAVLSTSLFETPPSTFTVAVAVEVPSFNETKTNSNAAKTGNVADPTPLVKQNSNSSVLSTSTDVETSGTVRVVLLRKAIAQAVCECGRVMCVWWRTLT